MVLTMTDEATRGATEPTLVAGFIRRFLRHPLFATQAKRMGKVVRVSQSGIRVWRLHADVEQAIGWMS